MKPESIVKFIKENLPKQAEDVCSMLSLFLDTLADLRNQIADCYKELEQTDDERFDLFRKNALEIKDIMNIVDGYMKDLTPEDADEELDESNEEAKLQTALDNATTEKEKRKILKCNYSSSELNTDTTKEHSLYENFTHTMPCAFRIFDQTIEALEWKVLLFKVCEYFYDNEKYQYEFIKIADDAAMQGSSRLYISAYKDKVPMAQKMKNINLYVIGKIGANGVRNYIMRMLSRFDIPKKNFGIFIRRDLSPLHIKSEKQQLVLPEFKENKLYDNENTYSFDDNYSFTGTNIRGIAFDGQKYDVKDWTEAYIKICESLAAKDRSIFNTTLYSPDFKGNSVSYFSSKTDGSRYFKRINGTNIWVWINTATETKCSLIKKLFALYNIPLNMLTIYLPENEQPLKMALTAKSTNTDGDDIAIGEYVRSTMRRLSEKNYAFSDSMLLKLMSANETKKLFGIGHPFFKEFNRKVNLSLQTKDQGGKYNRYWKEVFKFNNRQFLIVSQWHSGNKQRFYEWIKKLENNTL